MKSEAPDDVHIETTTPIASLWDVPPAAFWVTPIVYYRGDEVVGGRE